MFARLSAVSTLFIALAHPGVAQATYYSDFEADNGGLVGTNDWAHGSPTGANGSALGLGRKSAAAMSKISEK